MNTKRFSSIIFTLLFIAVVLGTVWGIARPLDREYAVRLLRWGQSDVKDYTRFPERTIANGGSVSELEQNLHPEWFSEVTYTVGGETYTTPIDSLMAETQTQALIVIQKDQIVYEKYYNGYERDSIVTSFSAAKSFNSALIGAAIDRELIGSVHDRMIDYLPELKGRGLDEMTIRDLLLMSSGIQYREDENMFPLLGAPFSDDAKTYYYPDLRQLALSIRAGEEPVGQSFHYNNYHPLLEGLILERVTGMPVAQFLEEVIWKPAGMEYPASWSLDSATSGFEKMESGINGRAIDFARFGLIYLHNGRWNEQQILPGDWIIESTAPDPSDMREWAIWTNYPDQGIFYKYHWWGYHRPDGHYDFSASGHLGQFIYICPKKQLLIARFGEGTGKVDSYLDVLFSIEEMVPNP